MNGDRIYSTVYFIAIFIPIFIGFEVGRGFVTDANPYNVISLPVFPVSTFFVLFSLIFSISKKNIVYFLGINLLFGLLSILIYGFFDLIRQFSYCVAILLGSAAYYSGLSFNRSYPYGQLVEKLTLVLVVIILAKLCFDLMLSGSMYSDFFITENFKIYNAYDYFPIIYLLSGALGILVFSESRRLGMVAVLVSFIALLTHSRYYAFSILLLYFLYFIRLYKIKTVQLMTLVVLCLIVITMVLAFFASSFNSDPSLALRFSHWYQYFSAVNLVDLLIPVFNAYRNELSWGGLHNELLELYSYFGIFTLILWVVVTRLVSNLNVRSKISIVPVLVILCIGMLVQNNLTQPYNAIVIFFLIGLFQKNAHSRM